jgi:hypothetical protein
LLEFFCCGRAPERLDIDGVRCLRSLLIGAEEAIIAVFGRLLHASMARRHQRASHARGTAAIGDGLRSAAPLFGRWIEAQWLGRSSLAKLDELSVARPETFAPAEAPFGAVDDTYPLAAMAAERPVFDEPKAIGPARAFRASEQRP